MVAKTCAPSPGHVHFDTSFELARAAQASVRTAPFLSRILPPNRRNQARWSRGVFTRLFRLLYSPAKEQRRRRKRARRGLGHQILHVRLLPTARARSAQAAGLWRAHLPRQHRHCKYHLQNGCGMSVACARGSFLRKDACSPQRLRSRLPWHNTAGHALPVVRQGAPCNPSPALCPARNHLQFRSRTLRIMVAKTPSPHAPRTPRFSPQRTLFLFKLACARALNRPQNRPKRQTLIYNPAHPQWRALSTALWYGSKLGRTARKYASHQR